MVVVGDVCGKGAEAAAITALAKYTMRAAAIRDGADPCTVHARLNEALLRQREDLRFVSAVCAFVEPLEGGGATMSVCVAGHLPPLRVGADGAVTRVAGGPRRGAGHLGPARPRAGARGAGPRRAARAVHRRRAGRRPRAGADRGGVRRDAGPGVAHSSAAETVSLIEREVVQGGALRGRDDVAVLVISPDAED